jgi:hypothetical protein
MTYSLAKLCECASAWREVSHGNSKLDEAGYSSGTVSLVYQTGQFIRLFCFCQHLYTDLSNMNLISAPQFICYKYPAAQIDISKSFTSVLSAESIVV